VPRRGTAVRSLVRGNLGHLWHWLISHTTYFADHVMARLTYYEYEVRMFMRKVLAAVTAGLLLVGAIGGAAFAQAPPPHGHMLVLHPDIQVVEGVPTLVGFHRCVDVANNRALPNHAHHEHLHTGAAGAALFAAGHAVVPTSPLTSWANCAAFEAALPIQVGGPPPA
jgi:hypothetical protein